MHEPACEVCDRNPKQLVAKVSELRTQTGLWKKNRVLSERLSNELEKLKAELEKLSDMSSDTPEERRELVEAISYYDDMEFVNRRLPGGQTEAVFPYIVRALSAAKRKSDAFDCPNSSTLLAATDKELPKIVPQDRPSGSGSDASDSDRGSYTRYCCKRECKMRYSYGYCYGRYEYCNNYGCERECSTRPRDEC